MTAVVHPGSRVDDDPGPLLPEIAAPELERPPLYTPLSPYECTGPGPLMREVRWSPHTIAADHVEDCPDCDGTKPHRFVRRIELEDQEVGVDA